MKAALYARVSTLDKDQNPEVQLSPMRDYCRSMAWASQEYIDKAPAADLQGRNSWSKMMKDASLRKFDVLMVWKLDRAFRSLIHAKTTVDILRRYNIHFRSLNDPGMDTNTPNGELLFNILASFAQYEKDIIAQRVTAGMDYARVHGTRSGKPIGRQPLNITLQDIYSAIRTSSTDGKHYSYTRAAAILSSKNNESVSAGAVHLRLGREAERRQIAREDLIKEILSQSNER